MTKTLHIELYGRLKDQLGFAVKDIQSTAATPRQVWQEITAGALSATSIRPAINDAFAGWDDPVSEGDKVAFLPPSSGG